MLHARAVWRLQRQGLRLGRLFLRRAHLPGRGAVHLLAVAACTALLLHVGLLLLLLLLLLQGRQLPRHRRCQPSSTSFLHVWWGWRPRLRLPAPRCPLLLLALRRAAVLRRPVGPCSCPCLLRLGWQRHGGASHKDAAGGANGGTPR